MHSVEYVYIYMVCLSEENHKLVEETKLEKERMKNDFESKITKGRLLILRIINICLLSEFWIFLIKFWLNTFLRIFLPLLVEEVTFLCLHALINSA